MTNTTKTTPNPNATSATEEPLPFLKPGWFASRKFISAVVSSVALWAVTIATGSLSVETALVATGPLLAWIGVEGAVDAVRASKAK